MAAVLSGEGGSYLGRKKIKMCLIAFGLTNNDIDPPCGMSRALMFQSDVITSEQRQTSFAAFCIQTPTASKRCVCISGLLVTQHPPTLPSQIQFSI